MPDLEYQVLMESLKNWNFQTLLKNHKKCYKTVFYGLPYISPMLSFYTWYYSELEHLCVCMCVSNRSECLFIQCLRITSALSIIAPTWQPSLHPQLTVVGSYHAVAVYSSFKMARSRNMNDVHRLIMGKWWVQSKRTHIWIPLSGVPEQAVSLGEEGWNNGGLLQNVRPRTEGIGERFWSRGSFYSDILSGLCCFYLFYLILYQLGSNLCF